MEISPNGIGPGSTGGKKWKLTDAMKEKIAKTAKEDARSHIYMSDRFNRLRKAEVSKAAPDRAALIGQISRSLAESTENQKEIREADERWLRIFFGAPYKAKIQSEGFGSAVHIYDENGDEILTYTGGVGWHTKESKAESAIQRAMKSAYYEAYQAAAADAPAGMDAPAFQARA